MTTPNDLKSLGLPTQHAPMSKRMAGFAGACLAVIAWGSVYVLVTDTPDRKAVDINVTMTSTEYAEALEKARKQGEADALKRLRACDWRDTFSTTPPLKRGPM